MTGGTTIDPCDVMTEFQDMYDKHPRDEWMTRMHTLPDKEELQNYIEGREHVTDELCDLLHLDKDSVRMLLWTIDIHGVECLWLTFGELRERVTDHTLWHIEKMSHGLYFRLVNAIIHEKWGKRDKADIYGEASKGELKAFADMCRHGINEGGEADLFDAYKLFIIRLMGAHHIPNDLWEDVVLFEDEGDGCGEISIRSSINGQTASGDPIIILPYQETVDSPETRDIFAECVRLTGKNRGVVVAFSFTKRAYKVAATLKEKNGINLELVTVRELLDSNPEVDT